MTKAQYELFIWFYSAFISLAVGLAVFSYDKREKSYIPKDDAPLYPSHIGTSYSMSFLLYLPLLFLVSFVDRHAIFLHLTVIGFLFTAYLAFFLLMMPLFRRFLQASSCAALWSVLLIQLMFTYRARNPKWCFALPFSTPSEKVISVVLWVWLLGYIGALLWHIAGHFIFRRRLLRNATPLDGNEHALFQKWLQITNFPAGYLRAVRSPAAKTPVSIGLFRKTTYLVLPEKDYTPEELALIFHHEVVHISRRDSLLKFTMVAIASMFWFHPLVWIALKRCAEDLELSCDEAVMYGRSQAMRQKYASLLLDTACPSPGFTSCLSASAGALRYRLKNIVRPKKRMVGGLLIGILCFALALLSMHTTVRFAPAPTKEQIFHGEDLAQIEIPQVMSTVGGVDKDGYSADRELLTYIAGLSLAKTGETPDVYEFGNWVQIDLRSPTHGYRLAFGGNYLRVSTYDYSLPDNAAGRHSTDYYYLESQPDWELLNSYIVPK